MDSLYSVVVRLGMESSGFASGATLAMGLLQRLEQQAAATGTSTAALGKSLGMVAGGMALIAGGMAGVGVLKSWATAAGDFQSAMAGVGLSTQGTAAQLAALGQQTFITANKTQFSAVDVATIEKLAATNGLNQRDVLLRIVPTLGNLAEIDKQLRGISYEQSVPAAITVAHDFQSYPKNATEAKGFTKLLDLFGRSQLVAGTTPDAMAKLITYLSPARAAYNLTPEDIISTAALASNVGLAGGKGGGSRIMAMFRAIAPLLSSRGALHNAAQDKMQELGGGHYFKDGDFEKAGGVANMLIIVEKAMAHIKDQGKRMSLLTAAFGSAGATAISIMATPGAVDRFQSIQGLLGPTGIASTDTMQGTLNATYQGQLATLAGNITSIKTLLGESLLPVITPVIHAFVDLTGGIVTVLRTHPALAQFVSTFALISTAAALVAGPVLIAAGAIGLFAASGLTLTAVMATVTGVLLPIIGTVALVAAAVAGVTWAVTHWGDIMAWARDHMILLHNAVFALSILFPPLGVAIAAGVLMFTHWHEITRAVGGALGALHPLIQAVGAVVGPVVAAIGSGIGAFARWINATDLLAGVLPALAGVLPAVGSAVVALEGTLGELVSGAIAGFNGAVTWLNTHIPLLSQALALLAWPLTVAVGIFTHWSDITKAMGTVLGTVGAALKGFGDLAAGVATIVRGLADWIGHLIETVLRLASGPVRAALGGIGTAINAVGGVAGGIGGMIGGAAGAAAGAAGAAAGAAGAAAGAAGGAVGGAAGGAVGGAARHTTLPGLPLLPTIPVAPAVPRHYTHPAHPATHAHAAAVIHQHAAPTTVHLHVAAGAVVTNVHPAPGHDPRKIADVITTTGAAALAKEFAAQLARSGIAPSTMRPTLHQLGTP